MTQLTLFPLDWRVVVPLDPQPYQASRFDWMGLAAFRGDWVWHYAPGMYLISTYPENGRGYNNSCPFKPGVGYEDGVVESVELVFTRSDGWVWVLHLREFNDTEYEPYWDLLRGRQPKNSQWPDETDGV